MRFIHRFLMFWYDFIVGDDWLVAVGVLVLLALTGLLAQMSLHSIAWVLLPVGVVVVLAISLSRAVSSASN